MSGGATSLANLSDIENKELLRHLAKHKIYPYKFRFKKTINGTNYANSDSGGGGSYFSLSWTPKYYTGIVYFAANFIITPNSTVGTFGLFVSYSSTINFGDNATPSLIDLEGTDVYSLISNGGAVNDFQVFFPLNWYLEVGKTIYVHIWADSSTVTAGTSTVQGQFTFGTMISQRQ